MPANVNTHPSLKAPTWMSFSNDFTNLCSDKVSSFHFFIWRSTVQCWLRKWKHCFPRLASMAISSRRDWRFAPSSPCLPGSGASASQLCTLSRAPNLSNLVDCSNLVDWKDPVTHEPIASVSDGCLARKLRFDGCLMCQFGIRCLPPPKLECSCHHINLVGCRNYRLSSCLQIVLAAPGTHKIKGWHLWDGVIILNTWSMEDSEKAYLPKRYSVLVILAVLNPAVKTKIS